ncbi:MULTISPECIES: aspartate/glutamate racemase family protein [Amycolatopsis]|uniref:Hydantoin racemase n=1 Tax=Amycolatopsis dendrobii TaxID=2760662 RepID=A0A7W3W8B3_9PSEU|nr:MULTISPECIES: aspartate/glutamate racemase family protein [Amycolatopsis]MBB1160252.1 Asp/Glu/hydantoin racemase [Amycolatopsis dendrobii]UKD58431.1 aspartate/glutamate racemase family protein [Amycolatopsis sp. FU40]
MRILVTNCNTTEAMTKEIETGARAAASPGTEIVALTPKWGPESAEGWLDSFLSAAAVLDLLRTTGETFDAVVLAGFGEHGREGARELLDVPVVDITEAAAHLAGLLGRRYGVVTTLDRTCGLIEDSLHSAGVDRNCVAVVGTGLSVLELRDEERTESALLTAGLRARDAGAEVLVLGCAGMTGLDRTMSAMLDVPVIDGVAAAVRLAESLVALGLRTSRAGSYARPLDKHRTWPGG